MAFARKYETYEVREMLKVLIHQQLTNLHIQEHYMLNQYIMEKV